VSNIYGISKEVETKIRARDKTCVYCRVLMKRTSRARGAAEVTIEHFNNRGPYAEKYNVAICCRGCNSSKGTKKLLVWFESSYCVARNIHSKTVAAPVKHYIRYCRTKNDAAQKTSENRRSKPPRKTTK
jgi:hypothetical protein